jgi:hypothetical protein
VIFAKGEAMKLPIWICIFVAGTALLWGDTDSPCHYACGDVNCDEAVDVGDAVYLINNIFRGGPNPQLPGAADPNNDGAVNIGDVVCIINYVFRSGQAPECSETYANCGVIITDLPPDSIQLDHHNLLTINIEGNIIDITTSLILQRHMAAAAENISSGCT